MTKLEKQHKNEVKKLKAMEDELSDLILKTEKLDLMTAFNDWQEQRNVCNSVYNDWLAETLKSVSGGK